MLKSNIKVRQSARAKRLILQVHPDGYVVVTKPKHVSLKSAEVFVSKHQEWIEASIEKFKKRIAKKQLNLIVLPRPRKNSNAYKEARKVARVLVSERLVHFNALYGFTYGTISIRDQKTRWGSCSAKGNLSFNYRIAYLPEAFQDYIIVHELCHTKEHNHSERFWAQVGRAIPEHVSLRKALRSNYAS